MTEHLKISPSPDDIASAVLQQFSSLPAKYKPSKGPNGMFNWVPLSGIVIEKGTFSPFFFFWKNAIHLIANNQEDRSISCVALA
jgi:hypothetical protein